MITCTHKEVKVGEWFTYASWHHDPVPLLKVSHARFYQDGEFISFKESIFVDMEGNPADNILRLKVSVLTTSFKGPHD